MGKTTKSESIARILGELKKFPLFFSVRKGLREMTIRERIIQIERAVCVYMLEVEGLSSLKRISVKKRLERLRGGDITLRGDIGLGDREYEKIEFVRESDKDNYMVFDDVVYVHTGTFTMTKRKRVRKLKR